jgi:DNA-binding Lrp family transcriptional regulator
MSKYDDLKKDILDYIKKNPKINQIKLREHFDMSFGTLRKRTKDLVDEGKIDFKWERNDKYYYIKGVEV